MNSILTFLLIFFVPAVISLDPLVQTSYQTAPSDQTSRSDQASPSDQTDQTILSKQTSPSSHQTGPSNQTSSSHHTACYNYFLQKDECVFSAATTARCPAPKKGHSSAFKLFTAPTDSQHSKRYKGSGLARRYDDPKGSFPIHSGDGICGTYDSEKEIGVCLWSGAEQTNPTPSTAGWLNGPNPANCGKRVYVQRTGHPETVQYAKVIDGCSFETTSLAEGCFEIGLTIELFNRFHPNTKEQTAKLIQGGLTWDFNNLNGLDSSQGPV